MENEGKKNISSNIPWYIKLFFYFVLAFLAFKGWENKNLILPKKAKYRDQEFGISDNCYHNKIGGDYILSVFFEKSDKADFDNKLEIFYEVTISQNGCNIEGKGYKIADVRKTEFGGATGKVNYNPNDFPIQVKGKIENEVLNLSISRKTLSSKDDKVQLKLALDSDKIESFIDGTFVEKETNGSGRAKLMTPSYFEE